LEFLCAVEEHVTTRLTRREQEVFVAALLDPQAATARLRRAAQAYPLRQKDSP